MAVSLDEIRSAAQRVAASHGLDVVDIEFTGPAKERVLRVSLEKNAEGRAQLKAAIAAGGRRRIAGEASGGNAHGGAAFRRNARRLRRVQPRFWCFARCGRPGSRRGVHAGGEFAGLDRKLSRPEDFERFAGCLVKVRTFEPVRNNRHWQGRLVAGPKARRKREDHARSGRGEAEQQEPQGGRQHSGDRPRQH